MNAAIPTVSTVSEPRQLVEVADLTVHFPVRRQNLAQRHRQVVHAVDGVDLAIPKGTTVGLVGESGSGKTTVGLAILQLCRPTSGSVKFDGVELTKLRSFALRRMRRRMQMIFQDPYGSLDPRMRIKSIIAEPLAAHRFVRRGERANRVAELLELVGMSRSSADRFPHEFSGGQRQRIGIARALAAHPDFVVADEPISSLDVSIRAQIVNLLDDLQQRLGLAYLFIAHDLSIVRYISSQIAVMYLGQIVESASRNELFRQPLHPYTQALLAAVPIPDPPTETARKRIVLTGDLPSPVNPPSGCRFHTRCPLRIRLGNPDRCVTEAPRLSRVDGAHSVACHFAEAN